VSEPEIVESWSTVEFPILRAIVYAQQSGSQNPHQAAWEAVPGIDARRLITALFWLYDAGYIRGTGSRDGFTMQVTGAKPKALRITGAWPSPESELARLSALLDEQIAAADGEAKTRLERFRDALAGMGQSVGTSLLTTYLGRYLPPP
jgi:hypothetical protein